MTEQTASVEELIRLVVGRKPRRENIRGSAGEDIQEEELLLDVEVDGARYLLVRLPQPMQREIQLSPREHEIVRLVALGHSNKMIAGVLNISSWTVCTHLRRIFNKLGVGSRAAAVARIPEMRNLRLVPTPDDSVLPKSSHQTSREMTATLASVARGLRTDPIARHRPYSSAVSTSR